MRAALAQGQPQRVLGLASQHRREHKDGMLHEEVQLLKISALCTVGPRSRFERELARFERAYPDSPLRAHIPTDCP